MRRELQEIRSSSTLVHMPNILRAKELLENFPYLWKHPGVSDAQRQSFILEVFDEVRIRGRDIVAISPKAQYAPHFAYVALSKERCLKSGRPESNQRPLAPHVGVLPSCATAASNLVIRSEYTFHHSDHSDGNYEYPSLNLISKVLSIVSSAPPYFPLIHISFPPFCVAGQTSSESPSSIAATSGRSV